MTPYAPQTHLETHEVTNVPPLLAARNLYTTDAAFAGVIDMDSILARQTAACG